MTTHGQAKHLARVGQLTDLADRLDLQELVARLGACLDEHRFEELGALLTDDATATTPGGVARGRAAAVEQVTRNHKDYDRLQHLATSILIDLDGDRAAIRANMVGIFGRSPEPVPVRAIGGVFRLGTVRTEDGWRISSLEVKPVWLHGEAPVPAGAPVAAGTAA
jgi:hypothetical protein